MRFTKKAASAVFLLASFVAAAPADAPSPTEPAVLPDAADTRELCTTRWCTDGFPPICSVITTSLPPGQTCGAGNPGITCTDDFPPICWPVGQAMPTPAPEAEPREAAGELCTTRWCTDGMPPICSIITTSLGPGQSCNAGGGVPPGITCMTDGMPPVCWPTGALPTLVPAIAEARE